MHEEFYKLFDFCEVSSAHAYLICSSDEAAQMLMARRVIEYYNCKMTSADTTILPEGERLSVSDIEVITSSAAITPLHQEYKLYVLKNGDTISDAAANKLLKTLEEPPSFVRIIILASSDRAVLPTIRSRCSIINIPTIPQAKLDQIADKVYFGSDRLQKAKALSEGSISRLIKAADGGFDDVEALAADTLLSMASSKDAPAFAIEIAGKKDKIEDYIDMLELILHDAVRVSAGQKPRLSHMEQKVSAVSNRFSADTVVRLSPVFSHARHRIKFHGYAASVVDQLLFSLLEIRQKCQG